VTDRRQSEQRRRQAEVERAHALMELERSNAELEQFAHVASHDLSEPLRVVGGFVGLLQRRYEGQLDADADRFIDATVSGVERMQALIDALLAYSRVGSGDLVAADVGSGTFVRSALEGLAARIEETGARVTVADDLPAVHGDAVLLERVVQNLVSNAIKFAEDEAPEVEIGAEPAEDGAWAFHVRDSGAGIPPEHAERVFGMFQRLHGRETPGTGIGLPITRRIVERHGGRIWVEPVDHGTEIRFTLPGAES
jgi:light-regulated signal transduction histidine kinase (bacteriophytochrome)